MSTGHDVFGGGQKQVSDLVETEQQPLPTQQDDDEARRRVELILANPIIRNIRDQELGKVFLGVSVPITTAFTIYFFYLKSPPILVTFVVVLLSIGYTAIFDGLLLRDHYKLTATFMELVGIATVLLAANGMVGSFLPPGLRWIGGLIGIATVAPLVIAATIPPNNM